MSGTNKNEVSNNVMQGLNVAGLLGRILDSQENSASFTAEIKSIMSRQ